MDEWEAHLRDDLFEVAEQLRSQRHEPTGLRLDELKRRVLARSTVAYPPRQGRRSLLRSKIVILGLVSGLLLGGGGAGVIAAGGGSPSASATKTEYKCNSGNGNGPEVIDPVGGPGPADCDPGNSAGNNADSPREGNDPSIPPP